MFRTSGRTPAVLMLPVSMSRAMCLCVLALSLSGATRPELAQEIAQRFAGQLASDQNPKPWLREVLARDGAPTFDMVGREGAEDFLTLAGSTLAEPGLRLAIEKYGAAKAEAVPEFAVEYLRARLKFRLDEARALPPPSKPELRDQIEALYTEDQRVRQGQIQVAAMSAMDAKHLPVLEAMLNQNGMPTFDMVGRSAASHFAVMFQHMPVGLRDQSLPLLKKNVDAGQANATDYAMEFDRTENDHGRSQSYGENFHCGPDKAFVPYAIADTDHLAERRAGLGLEPIGSKTRMIRMVYGDSLCK
jgi:hypothetical protein